MVGVPAFHRHQLTLIQTSLCRRMDLTRRPVPMLLRPLPRLPSKLLFFFYCFYFMCLYVTWVLGPKIFDLCGKPCSFFYNVFSSSMFFQILLQFQSSSGFGWIEGSFECHGPSFLCFCAYITICGQFLGFCPRFRGSKFF